MAKERVQTFRNTGSAEEPKWEQYFVKTLAECIFMSDGDEDPKTIVTYITEQLTQSKEDMTTAVNKLLEGYAKSEHTHKTADITDLPEWVKEGEKPTYFAEEVGAIPETAKGTAGGVASLDGSGHVPAAQLPSYVDDVIEGKYVSETVFNDSEESPVQPESGKIYLDTETNKQYRWSGSKFVVISESLALGETPSTAYYGDKGKAAYDHSTSPHAPTDAEKNKIETISVNGANAAPDGSRNVEISVPVISFGTQEPENAPANSLFFKISE